ncbi:FHIPEP family type III secretion protein, partial [Salmonella enterica subsp. enterica serovar Cerro]|nr:FHIPEP family type III secretion protein [Salmonella enterica subsp. enterica serovar Cerro]
FRDKSGEINVIIPSAVFDGREVQPDQMININGSLDKKAKEPLEDEAKKRRSEVTQEADFYGSMDGASKFVRGDAIAGILIMVIN